MFKAAHPFCLALCPLANLPSCLFVEGPQALQALALAATPMPAAPAAGAPQEGGGLFPSSLMDCYANILLVSLLARSLSGGGLPGPTSLAGASYGSSHLHVGLTPKVSISQCPLFPPLFELVSLILGGNPPTPLVMDGPDTSVRTIRSPPFIMGGHLSLQLCALTLAVLLILMGGFPGELHFTLQMGMFPVSIEGLTTLAVCLRWCTVRMVPSAHMMAYHRWCSDPMARPFTGFHMCWNW